MKLVELLKKIIWDKKIDIIYFNELYKHIDELKKCEEFSNCKLEIVNDIITGTLKSDCWEINSFKPNGVFNLMSISLYDKDHLPNRIPKSVLDNTVIITENNNKKIIIEINNETTNEDLHYLVDKIWSNKENYEIKNKNKYFIRGYFS